MNFKNKFKISLLVWKFEVFFKFFVESCRFFFFLKNPTEKKFFHEKYFLTKSLLNRQQIFKLCRKIMLGHKSPNLANLINYHAFGPTTSVFSRNIRTILYTDKSRQKKNQPLPFYQLKIRALMMSPRTSKNNLTLENQVTWHL